MALIVIEGNIGAGKSTILKALAKLGYPVICEPLDDWGECVWKMLYSEKEERDISRANEIILKSRLDMHVRGKKMSMECGRPAIIERSYQVVEHVFLKNSLFTGSITEEEYEKCSKKLRKTINKICPPTPDGVIFLSLDPKLCYERVESRNEKSKSISFEFLKALELQYKSYLQQVCSNVVYVDSGLPFTETLKKVQCELEKF